MYRIIVSDIFGRTATLEKMANSLPGNVEICDPYDTGVSSFESEHEAYSCFSSKVGLNKYVEKLARKVRSLPGAVTLLGFSMGGSAIWRLSSTHGLKNVSGAVCFYSSQVRHYSTAVPNFPIQMIFPKEEPMFSVSRMMEVLATTPQVDVSHSSYLHGFMNPQSQNYNEQGYRMYSRALNRVPADQCFTSCDWDESKLEPGEAYPLS
ncbi:dienelactone hydrolase family protein [Parendozoicomonas sp. Alg238-R29]|uniref:dienelactone hydrolase family protein n=1 Tax=Parendozoicomonas sp. Alg238-R29 TaxID=2993446 RepID=UPI00248DC04C|nr:dienelactone hydrolase family protein [Parendozoicomonas sp. Alg238-R29]